jgi:hypothetical protein
MFETVAPRVAANGIGAARVRPNAAGAILGAQLDTRESDADEPKVPAAAANRTPIPACPKIENFVVRAWVKQRDACAELLNKAQAFDERGFAGRSKGLDALPTR